MVFVCEQLEAAHSLPAGRLRFEVQMETPQLILSHEGTVPSAALIHAGEGRVSSLHYGTYDYSASLGIAAAYQSMEHPAADYAKNVMQVASRRHRRAPLRRLDQHPAPGRPGAGPGGLGAACPAGAPPPGTRDLPGLGPAREPAGHPLPGDLRVLPRGLCRRRGPPAQLRAPHRIGHHGRTGNRQGAGQLHPPRPGLRRPGRRGDHLDGRNFPGHP